MTPNPHRFIGRNQCINKNDAHHVQLVHSDYSKLGSGTDNIDGHTDIFVEDISIDVGKHHVAPFFHRLASTREHILMGWRRNAKPIGVITDYSEHPFIKDVCVIGPYCDPRKEGVFYFSFNHPELTSKKHRIDRPSS